MVLIPRHSIILLVALLISCEACSADRKKVDTLGGAPPADLDVDTVIAEVGDPNPPGQPPSDLPWSQAARVIKDFKSAGPLAEPPQGGRLIFFGRAYTIEASGRDSFQYQFLWIEPSAASPSGMTGFSKGLIPDDFKEEMDARGVLDALRKKSSIPEGSKTLRYLKTAGPDGKPYPLLKSTGISNVLTAPSQIYIRQKDNRVLMVERLAATAPSRKTPWHGAGRYSELWKLP